MLEARRHHTTALCKLGHDLIVQPDVHFRRAIVSPSVAELLRQLFAGAKAAVELEQLHQIDDGLFPVVLLVLRVREPNLPRRFTTPWVWFVAPAGALSALALMASLPWPTWRRLIVWFIIGIVFYFCYGVRRSHLARPRV